jgi:DNA processing protein
LRPEQAASACPWFCPYYAEPSQPPVFAADFNDRDHEAARTHLTELLSASPMPVDEIARRCHFFPTALSAALMELELIGRIEALPGNRVGLIAPV